MRRRHGTAGLAVLMWAAAATATTITVTTTEDEINADGDCSLREAVVAANTDTAVDACPAGHGVDAIVVPAGTYTLSRAGADEDAAATGDLDLTDSVVVSGAGAAETVVQGSATGATDRVFDVRGDVTVVLSGLTIGGGSLADGVGGGVRSTGADLTIADCYVTENGAAAGGGIAAVGGSLRVTDSRMRHNVARSDASATILVEGATTSIARTTFGDEITAGSLGTVGDPGEPLAQLQMMLTLAPDADACVERPDEGLLTTGGR